MPKQPDIPGCAGLSVRLCGQSKAHIQRAADAHNIYIKSFWKREHVKDAKGYKWYGYGELIGKYETTPSKKETQHVDD